MNLAKGYHNSTLSIKKSDWSSTPTDKVTACSRCVTTPRIIYEQLAYEKVNWLMTESPLKSIEWFAYLDGENHINDKGYAIVKDIIVPPHEEVSSVVALPDPDWDRPETIIGGMHSHHTMYPPRFSSTDWENINANENVSVLVAISDTGKLDFIATSRVDLPCGSFKDTDSLVIIERPSLELSKDWQDEAVKEIKKGKSTYTYGSGYATTYNPKLNGQDTLIGESACLSGIDNTAEDTWLADDNEYDKIDLRYLDIPDEVRGHLFYMANNPKEYEGFLAKYRQMFPEDK